jgi:O-antigen/teichoic acid export membrane protein
MDDSRLGSREPALLQPGPAPAVATGVSGATWVAVAMAVANGLGYLLNLVSSRVLGPSGFGALGALLGLILIGNVAALGLQAVTARVLAADRAAAASHAAALYRLALLSAAGVAALALAAAPMLTELLHLTDAAAVWLLPLVLAPLTVTGVQLGLLQGTERFRSLGNLYVVAAAGKVGGGLVGAMAGGSVTSTIAGTAVGATLSAATGHVMVRGLLGGGAGRIGRERVRELLYATHSLLVLFALTNVDVLLARHYLPGPEAGRYAVGAVVAKGAFWLPGFVAVVALPALSDAARRRRAAVRSIAAVAACGVAATAVCAVFGDLVVALVGGSAYASLAPRVWLFAAAGSLYALAQLLLYSRLAATDRRALVAVWAALLFLVVLVVGGRHDSTTEIIVSVIAAATALVGTGALAEVHEHREQRRASDRVAG